jgi:hypothetical protein
VNGERPPRLLAERVAPAHGGIAVAEPVKREGRVLAEVARVVMAQFEGRHLLISGPPRCGLPSATTCLRSCSSG